MCGGCECVNWDVKPYYSISLQIVFLHHVNVHGCPSSVCVKFAFYIRLFMGCCSFNNYLVARLIDCNYVVVTFILIMIQYYQN